MAALTDMPLDPDPLFGGRICDECGECLKACPARAMDAQNVQEAALCEGKARWYAIHLESCAVCKTGPMSRPYSPGGEPSRVAAACGRACVAHLEEIDALTKRFHHSFRDSAQAEAEACPKRPLPQRR